MKPKRKLKVYKYPNCVHVAVGYVRSRLAVAWFWDNLDSDPLKAAEEYVAWKNSKNAKRT